MSGSPQRWRVLWATFAAYLFDSYDLTVLALAMPVLLKLLGMSLPEAGLLGSATALGAMAGGVVFGLIAENRGRRFALVLALLWLGVGMAAVYLVHTWAHWMALRFFTGLAIGGVWGPCAALIAQHWSAEHRGRAASFVFSSFAIGAAVAAAVGRSVLETHWEWLFLAGAVSIPAAVLAWHLIPADRPAPAPGAARTAPRVGIGAIFTREVAPVTLAATLVSIVNLAGYWGAAFWIPTFLTKERGVSLTTMLGFSFVMYLGMFLGFQFFGWLADTVGRRKSMMAAFALCAVAIGVYIVVLDPMFLFWWGAVVGFGLCGAGGILGAYYAELFPEHLRAYAGGFCWNMGRVGAMAAPYTIGWIGKSYGLQSGLAVTCVVYVVGVLMLFLLPETFQREARRPAAA
ncbi:MFS transporter [Ramlibacter sp.]|uniref:MFS transporter n=1 Tax=Ramlibacter sp. TaxID=1917967 RepID=UPI002C83FAED|nr:MFS transporter [Ramlibacter sp.]HWI82372.1 MFS transporter [Ramlibacter sp.]